MKKKMIAAAMVMSIVLAAAGYGWYLYKKPPADVRRQKAAIELPATELLSAFEQDESAAGKKFTDKVLIVSGKISRIEAAQGGPLTVCIETGNPLASVICSFYADEEAAVNSARPGSSVRIKGKCNGMLMDVILNQCSFVK